MLEIVYAGNSEQFLWENNEQFYFTQIMVYFFTHKKNIRPENK